MFFNKGLAFCLVFLIFTFPAFAQEKEDDAAKERQQKVVALLEQIVGDSRGLKLPENRAFVAAKAGAMIWKADEKQARKIFDGVAADLNTAQAEAEAQARNKQYVSGLITGQEPRWSILYMIANCDASLALEIMARTRPARIERQLADLNPAGGVPRRSKGDFQYGPAYTEVQNEQNLIGMAADQDPSRAIALVRESLKRGITYQTLTLLQKIRQKDAAAANRLTEDAMRKLMEADLFQNWQQADVIGYFLGEVTRAGGPDEAILRVPDSVVRDLVEKLLDYWLDPDVTGFNGNNSFPVIEKYSPGRAARVKQKFAAGTQANQTPQQLDYQRMMTGEIPVEEMVQRAGKMPQYMRNEIYRRAAEKLAESGAMAQAQKLIEDNLPETEVENYLSQIGSNQAYRTIAEGKFNEANDIISCIPNPDYRINLLVHLANSIYQKDPKANDKWAASVLGQARAVLPEEPETYEDYTGLFNIATASAQVDTESAFRTAETLAPRLNELAQANATLAKLRNYGNFRNGEFQIMSGQYAVGVSGMEGLLNALKEKDFDRTVRITNEFTRLDARIAYQLQLIDPGSIYNLPINGRNWGGLYVIDGRNRN